MLDFVTARGIYWLLLITAPFKYCSCLTSTSKYRKDNLYEKGKPINIYLSIIAQRHGLED
jgi:hypothetical protein